jgi:hypothetical protein
MYADPLRITHGRVSIANRAEAMSKDEVTEMLKLSCLQCKCSGEEYKEKAKLYPLSVRNGQYREAVKNRNDLGIHLAHIIKGLEDEMFSREEVLEELQKYEKNILFIDENEQTLFGGTGLLKGADYDSLAVYFSHNTEDSMGEYLRSIYGRKIVNDMERWENAVSFCPHKGSPIYGLEFIDMAKSGKEYLKEIKNSLLQMGQQSFMDFAKEHDIVSYASYEIPLKEAKTI